MYVCEAAHVHSIKAHTHQLQILKHINTPLVQFNLDTLMLSVRCVCVCLCVCVCVCVCMCCTLLSWEFLEIDLACVTWVHSSPWSRRKNVRVSPSNNHQLNSLSDMWKYSGSTRCFPSAQGPELQTGCADAFNCTATVKICDVNDAFYKQFGISELLGTLFMSDKLYLSHVFFFF